MPAWGPVSRTVLIRSLRAVGFDGPYPGSRHMFMLRGTNRVILPNPHRGDISVHLLARILREAGISRDEWERV
jgi:predicted RNA binding protein YcfA (HicA-like mRNA interferase family)